MAKDKKKKSTCPKKRYQKTAQEIADLVGCSVSTVKQVRVGQYPVESETAIKIKRVDALFNDFDNELTREVERIVKV